MQSLKRLYWPFGLLFHLVHSQAFALSSASCTCQESRAARMVLITDSSSSEVNEEAEARIASSLRQEKHFKSMLFWM